MSLTRKLWYGSLKTRPLRYLLSTFGIVLGVAAILGISITNQSALNSVSDLFEDVSGKSDLVITASSSDKSGFPENILFEVDKAPGIISAVPSVIINTTLAEGLNTNQSSMNFFGDAADSLTLYGINPLLDPEVREYKIVAGRFIQPDLNSDEIVLVDSYADKRDIDIGKSIEIITERGVEKLSVVGLMSKEGPGRLNNGNFGVLPIQTAQKLVYKQNKFDQIDIVADQINNDSDELENLRKKLLEKLGKDYLVIFPATQGKQMSQMLENFQIGLNFLSAMALFVGAFLIYNAFSMSIVERTREFGMLRTVGMTRGQIVYQVITEAALLGIFGSLLGITLGIFISQSLSNVMGVVIGQEIVVSDIPGSILITGFLVGFITSILAAIIPAIQAGRISPLEAVRIRSKTNISFLVKHGWILGIFLLFISAVLLIINPFPNDKQFKFGSFVVIALFVGGTLVIPASVKLWEKIFFPIVRLLYGRIGKLGSANINRSKSRSTLTIAALMIGVAMIVIVWIMTDSFKGDLQDWLKGYMGGDLYISSAVPMGRDVWKRLESVQGVEAVSPVRYFETEWSTPYGLEETISIMAVEPNSYSKVTSFTFLQNTIDAEDALQQLAGGNSVFISSVISEKYGLNPGDAINLRTRKGSKNFIVSAVIVDYYNQGLVITGSWNDMERYFRFEDANLFLVKIMPDFQVDQIADEIDRLYGKRDRLNIESNKSLLDQISLLMEQAFSMFDIMAIIAILVGFFGIMNTLTMNVIERTQEIGMLRSIGMTRSQSVILIISEAAIMGLIGGFMGIIFGMILSRIFLLAMASMSGYSLHYFIPYYRILTAFIIAFIVSQLAALFPAVHASRTKILEAIQYE